MRHVIENLFNCLQAIDNDLSKQQLATIIRREVEADLQDCGLKSNNYNVTAKELRIACDGNKLEAVKAYKNRTGLSLMESKRAVEDAMVVATGSSY